MKKILFFFSVVILMLSSCSTTQSLGEKYAKLYEESPLTIAVMPPINQTNFAEAKDYFYTSMYQPLCEKGYYVYSPNLTMDLFQQEGAYDSEMFIDGDLAPFREVLGCDAVMFTRIKKWEKQALLGGIKVHIDYILKSAKTGDVLFYREGEITLNTNVKTGLGGGLGALVDLAATAINTAATDKIVAGRKCNFYCLLDLPTGKYSPLFQVDKNNVALKERIKGTTK